MLSSEFHFSGQYPEVGVGQECWSRNSNGIVIINQCSTGLLCGPWSPNGEIWDGTTPWYCQFNPKHTEGEICNYDLKVNKRKTLFDIELVIPTEDDSSKLSFQGWSVRLWSDLLRWTLYFWKLSTSNTKYKSKCNFFNNYGYLLIIFSDPSCVDTGLVGFNLCYNGATNENLGNCCPDYYSGSTQVYCLPTEDTPATQDR